MVDFFRKFQERFGKGIQNMIRNIDYLEEENKILTESKDATQFFLFHKAPEYQVKSKKNERDQFRDHMYLLLTDFLPLESFAV